MKNYMVQRGDTLYGISKQFGVSVEKIREANNLPNNTIQVGQQLKIPVESPSTSTTYTVKKGDTLYKIAEAYNTTVDELTKLNNLTTTTLQIGQQLKIPTENDSITYTVKKGDNLYNIANTYNTTVEEIKQLNGLTSNLLSIGQILKIPTNKIEINYKEYEVQPNDNLYKIAQMFNTTVETIVKENNLSSTILSVGQILKIPNQEESFTGKECYGEGYVEPQYETYTVKREDNLYDIARRYNTTVLNLMELNNLTTTNLQIGQILKVREL